MSMVQASQIESNLARLTRRIAEACRRVGRSPDSVRLVAVTKTASVDAVRLLYDLGLRDFGESRTREIWDRQPQLPADVRWHMIGHWQTNKVRKTLPLLALAHSIDRWAIAEAVSAECVRLGRTFPVLIEAKLTADEHKHGFHPELLLDAYPRLLQLPGLDICGLMAMASLEDDSEEARPVFRSLRLLRDTLQSANPEGPTLRYLSMGMSNDFEVAIEEGATHVRVGSLLFEGIQESVQ